MTDFPAEYKGFRLRWYDWTVAYEVGLLGALVARWTAYRPGDDLIHQSIAAFDLADTPHPSDTAKAAKQATAHFALTVMIDEMLS